MKRLAVILTIFLANANLLSRQWPEIDQGYKTNSTVDDGFGGNWRFNYLSNNIFFIRPSNKFPILFGAGGPHCFNEKLKLDEKSLPLDAGVNLAFYGYLTALDKYTDGITVSLKVNPDTGEIEEVAFMVLLPKNKIMHYVPPRCFTLYEDILKKTVRFKPLHGIVDTENTKGDEELNSRYGICYIYDVESLNPAEGEPNFLALPMNNFLKNTKRS